MSRRIDELFSPERIQVNWTHITHPAGGQDDRKEDGRQDANAKRSQCAALEFDNLKSHIHQQVSDNQAKVLDILMGELRELLNIRFPPPKACGPQNGGGKKREPEEGQEVRAQGEEEEEEGNEEAGVRRAKAEQDTQEALAAVCRSIEEKLNQIEDLLEAWDL